MPLPSCIPAMVMVDVVAIVGKFVPLVMHAYWVDDGAPDGDQFPEAVHEELTAPVQVLSQLGVAPA
jgi:hypothetical protein